MWKYTVEVNGMMCGMCEAHINDAVRKACPVKKVHSSRAKCQTVVLSEAELDPETIAAAIRSTGYEVGTIQKEPYQKRGSSVYNLKAASFNPQVVYGNPAILSMS